MAATHGFPRWLYAKDQPPKLVHDAVELAGVSEDWTETPETPDMAPAGPASAPPATAVRVQSFPTWRYHKTEPARIVKTAEELAVLGEGWYDHPDCGGEFSSPAPFPSVKPKKLGKLKGDRA